MTRIAFGRLTLLAATVAALDIHATLVTPSAAYGQVLKQVEQDVRRQVGPPTKLDPLGVPEVPAEPPGYLGLFADNRKEAGVGLRVMDVMQGGPAQRAGLAAGDVITAINGAAMRTLDDMVQVFEPLGVGRKVDFQIERAGVSQQVTVTLGVRPPRTDGSPRFGRQPEALPGPADATGVPGTGVLGGGIPAMNVPAGGGPLLGVRTVTLDGERRGLFKIPASAFGALVTSVVSGSAADKIGIQPGMLITSFDGQPVDMRVPQTLAGLVRAAGPGKQVEVGFRDQNGEGHRQMTVTGSFGAPADPTAAMIPHTSLSPNGDMQPEIGLPQEIPPGPGMFPLGGVDRRSQVDLLQQRVDLLEARIQTLEAALKATQQNAKP